MLKIVLDTNMFLSAILYHGMTKTIFDLVLNNKIELYVSSDLKHEVLEKLQEFRADEVSLSEAALFLDSKSIFVTPNVQVHICRDPKDNFILELAETSEADFIITRDKDLLDLPDHAWKNTKIMKPEKFLPLLRTLHIL